MVPLLFAAEETSSLPLGISLQTFVFQLITFVLVFLVLKRFAVKPIVNLLDKRHKTIDDGVRMGLTMEKEKAVFDKKLDAVMREARQEADKVIANANKEAREILRDSEKTAHRKTEAMFNDNEARLKEEAVQARKNLEKELIAVISDATEAIVGEKIDVNKDSELVKRAMKGQKQKS